MGLHRSEQPLRCTTRAEHESAHVGRLTEYNSPRGKYVRRASSCSHVFNHPAPAGPNAGAYMSEEQIVKRLPILVRTEFGKMGAEEQAQFMEEFDRKRKHLGSAYIASLLSLHYAYVGRWPMTFLMWLVGVATLGIGLIIWWLIDLFRIPSIIRDKNSDIAVSILRDQKIIAGYR